MTLSDALQLYAPLAGLLCVVFWLGVLSNRVATLERENRDRKATEKDEGQAGTGVRNRLLVLETTYQLQSQATNESLDGIKREIAGIHRMFANSMKPTSRRVKEFSPDGADR